MITEEFHVPLYMTRGEYYQARTMFGGFARVKSSWLGQEFYTRFGMDGDYFKRVGADWRKRMSSKPNTESSEFRPISFPPGFRRLEEGDILSIGNYDWHIVIDAGHSPEHVCLYCKNLKTSISGDQILPIITSNVSVSVHPTEPEANPLKVWMESHDRLLGLPFETFVLPAHNLPFYGVRERLRELINHHEDRMLSIEEHCMTPQTARSLLPVLFKRKLDARQTMMALGEAIAHCHVPMHRNRLDRQLHEDSVFRFVSTDPDLTRRSHPEYHDAPDDSPMLV